VKAADLLRFAPILEQVIPELSPCVGFDQRNPHHIFDVFTHTAHAVEAIAPDPALRLAALLHDIGKPATFTADPDGCGHFYGHAEVSAKMADAVLLRLRASNELRKRVTDLIARHMTPLTDDKQLLHRRLRQYGEGGVRDLLALQKADRIATGTYEDLSDCDRIAALLEELLAENACFTLKELALNGHDLMALGYEGRQIGLCLNALLEQVVSGQLPNERQALLDALSKGDTP